MAVKKGWKQKGIVCGELRPQTKFRLYGEGKRGAKSGNVAHRVWKKFNRNKHPGGDSKTNRSVQYWPVGKAARGQIQ